MKLKDLEPHLAAIYQKDQAKLAEIQRQHTDHEKYRDELRTPPISNTETTTGLEQSSAENRHRIWREQEALKLTLKIFELRLEIDKAKTKTKKSFGRLEALRHVIKSDQH